MAIGLEARPMCSECGGSLEGKRKDARTCSQACKQRRDRRAKSREAINAGKARWRARGLGAKAQSRYRQTEAGKAASRARSKWRKAQTKGALIVESFDSHAVFDRDGWRCHLCRKKVSRTPKNPHPLSASLDHIIPLTMGGEHSLANCATAHLGCNMAKSNHAANDQLRLIG